ncbi:hypothetical protein, partial [Nocardioides sp.]|uniref:hypothetical protein n=1 Tax=Nocardioides sp. TaxID=35761 RepID=UPI0039E4F302
MPRGMPQMREEIAGHGRPRGRQNRRVGRSAGRRTVEEAQEAVVRHEKERHGTKKDGQLQELNPNKSHIQDNKTPKYANKKDIP